MGNLNSTSKVKIFQSCLTLLPQRLYSLWNSPGQNTGMGSFSFSRWSFQPRDRTQVFRTAGRFFTRWDTREKGLKPAQIQLGACNKLICPSVQENVPMSMNKLNTAESCSLLFCWDKRELTGVCSYYPCSGCQLVTAPRLGGSSGGGVWALPEQPPASAAWSAGSVRRTSSPQWVPGSYSNAS